MLDNPFAKLLVQTFRPRSLEMSREEMLRHKYDERLDDPAYLPSIHEIREAFKLDNFHGNKIAQRSYWRMFCDSPDERLGKSGFAKYEIWTKEFIQAFSSFIGNEARRWGRTYENPYRVLEIAAGDGRLTHFLEQYRLTNAVRFKATDSGQYYSRDGDLPIYPVEHLDAHSALFKYRPDMAVVSWSPADVDFTKAIRDAGVKTYVVIGVADDSLTGRTYETYGSKTFPDMSLAPHERDGYVRVDMEQWKKFQISKCIFDSDSFQSSTVIFYYNENAFLKESDLKTEKARAAWRDLTTWGARCGADEDWLRYNFKIDYGGTIISRGPLHLPSQVAYLPDNLVVNGYLLFFGQSPMSELPKNLWVGGDFDLNTTSVQTLPVDLFVKGILNTDRGSPLSHLARARGFSVEERG